MKVKIFKYHDMDTYNIIIEKEINDFIKDKKIIDIKTSESISINEYKIVASIRYLVMYEEE